MIWQTFGTVDAARAWAEGQLACRESREEWALADRRQVLLCRIANRSAA